METYYSRNKERCKANAKRWYEANRVGRLLQIRQWEKDNPEKAKKYRTETAGRVDYPKCKVSIQRARKKWIKNNPEKYKLIRKINDIKRRTRFLGIGPINATEWKQKLASTDNKCQACFKTEPEIKITIDHIIPLSKGGTNDIQNLQPLCMLCNVKKGTKMPELPQS